MSRRPQILHVTDSATTRKLYGRSGSAGGYPSDPGRFDGERRYVSRSSLTLNGGYSDGSSVRSGSGLSRAHSYDENLGNDRYNKARSPGQPAQEDLFGEIIEEEETNEKNERPMLVEANNNYVTWTKSSASDKHWALLVDPSDTQKEVTVEPEVVDNRVISRILREVNSEKDSSTETDGAKKCMAVIASCPPSEDKPSVNRSISMLTVKKSGAPKPSPFDRNNHLRKSMSTLTMTQREQQKPPKIPEREVQKVDRSKAETEFDGLLQYLHDYRHGLRELLVNHNVVIIEPVRATAAETENEERQKQHEPKSTGKTCRVTGAIIKTPGNSLTNITSSNTLPRSQKPHQPIMRRQFFYHPIKINKEIVDAELPDPDTVKNARKVFEKGMKDIQNQTRLCKDDKLARLLTVDTAFRQEPTKRWMDTASLSSGVSSDLSCCETDLETSPRGCPPSCSNSSNQEVFSSGEESEQEIKRPAVRRRFVEDVGGNVVSEEVLQKIRACGTTTTYFGGRVISTSTGPLRSPMTMAIMDEIRRNAPSYGPNGRHFGMQQLGVKFRLVKSNSCGSRLELAGTENSTKSNRVQRSNTTGGEKSPTPSEESKPKVAPRKVDFQKGSNVTTVNVRPEVKGTPVKETAVVAPTPAIRTIIPKRPQEGKPKSLVANGKAEKDNTSETPSMTSWKICKMLDDLKRTSTSKHYIDNRPKPQLPQPGECDKFGVMEFEEFEVLET